MSGTIKGTQVHDTVQRRLSSKSFIVPATGGTPILLCISGVTNMEKRKLIRVQNNSGFDIRYNDSVSDCDTTDGIQIPDGANEVISATDAVNIYVISEGAAATIIVQEGY